MRGLLKVSVAPLLLLIAGAAVWLALREGWSRAALLAGTLVFTLLLFGTYFNAKGRVAAAGLQASADAFYPATGRMAHQLRFPFQRRARRAAP